MFAYGLLLLGFVAAQQDTIVFSPSFLKTISSTTWEPIEGHSVIPQKTRMNCHFRAMPDLTKTLFYCNQFHLDNTEVIFVFEFEMFIGGDNYNYACLNKEEVHLHNTKSLICIQGAGWIQGNQGNSEIYQTLVGHNNDGVTWVSPIKRKSFSAALSPLKSNLIEDGLAEDSPLMMKKIREGSPHLSIAPATEVQTASSNPVSSAVPRSSLSKDIQNADFQGFVQPASLATQSASASPELHVFRKTIALNEAGPLSPIRKSKTPPIPIPTSNTEDAENDFYLRTIDEQFTNRYMQAKENSEPITVNSDQMMISPIKPIPRQRMRSISDLSDSRRSISDLTDPRITSPMITRSAARMMISPMKSSDESFLQFQLDDA